VTKSCLSQSSVSVSSAEVQSKMALTIFILILLAWVAAVGFLGAKRAKERRDESARRIKEMIIVRHEWREARKSKLSGESVDNTFVEKRRSQLAEERGE